MDKQQAVKLQKRLLAVEDATSRAFETVWELDPSEQAVFADAIASLRMSFYRFDMLGLIYAQYPELRPPPDESLPPINSQLRWKKVKLPESISEADLDVIIFSMLTPRLQKTARVISRSIEHCQEYGLPINAKIFGARIEQLGETDRIESTGDLRYWGHSEIRLKG